MGDILSSAYPEMLKMSFPEMCKEIFMVPYKVEVNLRRAKNKTIHSHYRNRPLCRLPKAVGKG